VTIYAVRSMEFPSSEIKTEADSNDINDCSHDEEPSTGMIGLWFCNVDRPKGLVAAFIGHKSNVVNLSSELDHYDAQLAQVHKHGDIIYGCVYIFGLIYFSCLFDFNQSHLLVFDCM